MAHLHNLPHRSYQPSLLENIGQKVKTAGEIAGTLKGIYDVGKSIYTGIQTIRPLVQTASALI